MNHSNGNDILKLENLNIGYAENEVLKNINFSIDEGEVLAVVGQNGSGKSTLLKAISGLNPEISGNISIGNNHSTDQVPGKNGTMGISHFIQGGLIMPTLTVEEHLVLAAQHGHNGHNGHNGYNGHGNGTVFDHFPVLRTKQKQLAGNLSGGERQLLSLGMLLTQDAKIWLLDEPTAGLSPGMVNTTKEFLQHKKQQRDVTMLLVEHNMDVAFDLADHIVVATEGTLTRKYNRDEFLNHDFKSNYLLQ